MYNSEAFTEEELIDSKEKQEALNNWTSTINDFIRKHFRSKRYNKAIPSSKGFEIAAHMRGRIRHVSEEPNREMLAFLENIQDAAMADKENIPQMTETKDMKMDLCKKLVGTNEDQQALIK